MRKVLLATLIAIMLVIVPITTASKTANVTFIKNVTSQNMDMPQIFITETQHAQLIDYIESNYEGEEKEEAYEIMDSIINSNLEVDPIKLAEAWITYGYQPIPQEEIDNAETPQALELLIEAYWLLNNFANLVLFITSLIANRLGWLYYLINTGLQLFVEGLGLVIEFIYISFTLIKAFVSAVNQILTIPQVFAEALENLFNQQYAEFLYTLGDFVSGFAISFVDLLEGLILLLEEFVKIVDYLKDIVGYFLWIDSKPWTQHILITGFARKNLLFPIEGATVTCRGQTATSNEKGEFYFYIDPAPDESSIPPNEYYGMHNCKITIEKDGKILKESTTLLSYVFSLGYLYFPCLVFGGKSKSESFSYNIMERFSNLLIRLQELAEFFFWKTNGINPLNL
jgi:hypothetical protein